MAFELQGRDPVLLLPQQEHGQEPGRERQLGGLKEGAGRERGLMVTVTALQERARAHMHRLALATAQLGQMKPSGQRHCSSACSHCSSVPYAVRKSDKLNLSETESGSGPSRVSRWLRLLRVYSRGADSAEIRE